MKQRIGLQSFATITILVLACRPVGAAPTAGELLEQALAASEQGDSQAAVELATRAIAADPKLAESYYYRGRERFRLGEIRAAVEDFDRYVELRPERASRQWERGIALYYAGKFAEGAKQFELYQTYHDNDVENSVWRYLCMVPTTGVKKAQSVMLPIRDDRRVPMMQIFELYRGNLTPQAVLEKCTDDDPPPDVLAGRLFYAHLYLGLYFEVKQQPELAAKYIRLAARKENREARVNRYMWDVARIHASRLPAKTQQGQPKRK